MLIFLIPVAGEGSASLRGQGARAGRLRFRSRCIRGTGWTDYREFNGELCNTRAEDSETAIPMADNFQRGPCPQAA